MSIIHNLLSVGAYRVTEDSGIQIDPETTIATRRQSIVYRGSLASLYSTFRFGGQAEVTESQTRMYCSGAQSVRQIDGTSGNPFWQATIEHVGLHSYIHGSADAIFRLTPSWTVREVTLPQTYPSNADGSAEVTFYAGEKASGPLGIAWVPTGAGNYAPCTIHDHVPGYSVRGIIRSEIPIHPAHPQILILLAQPSFVAPPSASMVNYGLNPGAGYNWCAGMPEGQTTSGPSIGKWFVGDISAERIIEPMHTGVGAPAGDKIYQVNFPVRWLQRKAPV